MVQKVVQCGTMPQPKPASLSKGNGRQPDSSTESFLSPNLLFAGLAPLEGPGFTILVSKTGVSFDCCALSLLYSLVYLKLRFSRRNRPASLLSAATMTLRPAQFNNFGSWGFSCEEIARGFCLRQIPDYSPVWEPPSRLTGVELLEQNITHRQEVTGAVVYNSNGIFKNLPVLNLPQLKVVDAPQDAEAALERSLVRWANSGRTLQYIIVESWNRLRRKELKLPSLRPQANSRLLSTRDHIKGIHSPDLLLALGESFATMHLEDFHLGSAIIGWSGSVKMVLTIPPRETEKLEARVFSDLGLKGPPCSQFVRHEDIIVPPFQLRQWGIQFDLTPVHPGTVCRTGIGVYHYVWNVGPNMFESINCCDDDWLPPPSLSSLWEYQIKTKGHGEMWARTVHNTTRHGNTATSTAGFPGRHRDTGSEAWIKKGCL